MNLKEISIRRKIDWKPIGPENPLCAFAKLEDGISTVDVFLDEATMQGIMSLCLPSIEATAQRMLRFPIKAAPDTTPVSKIANKSDGGWPVEKP